MKRQIIPDLLGMKLLRNDVQEFISLHKKMFKNDTIIILSKKIAIKSVQTVKITNLKNSDFKKIGLDFIKFNGKTYFRNYNVLKLKDFEKSNFVFQSGIMSLISLFDSENIEINIKSEVQIVTLQHI